MPRNPLDDDAPSARNAQNSLASRVEITPFPAPRAGQLSELTGKIADPPEDAPAMKTLTHRTQGPSVDETQLFELPRREDEAPAPAPKAIRISREGVEPFVLPLYPDKTYTFGRAPESSVVFPSDAVSRLHGQLRFHDDGWVYRDLNSTNGTYLTDAAEGDRSDLRKKGKRTGSGARGEVAVPAGKSLLLGSSTSRLTFLAEVPEELAAPAGKRGASEATKKLERRVEVCARHRLPVFLLGPSGAGKTYVARQIHEKSRMEGTFVIINCGRLPSDAAALTSELLGHVKGAFTGAESARRGKLWSADGGTLFLDEVESLPRAAQDFLIDVLEGSGNFAPYGAPGDSQPTPPRFRVISASKVPLFETDLRPDLSQRLGAGDVVQIPSLKERAEDIPNLVEALVAQLHAEQRIEVEFTPEAVRFLQRWNWVGEVRELESTVRVVASRQHAERGLDGAKDARFVVGVGEVKRYLVERLESFGKVGKSAPVFRGNETVVASRKRPQDLTREEIERALTESGGNKTRAAQALGVALNTLKARLRTS